MFGIFTYGKKIKNLESLTKELQSSLNESNTHKQDLLKKIDEVKVPINRSFGFKTILDYGAVMYGSKEEALKGRKSIHIAEQNMLDEVGIVVYPPYGWYFKNKPLKMWRRWDNVTSLGNSNRGVHIVTDESNAMFLPFNEYQEIKGFTAHYVGPNIKDCAVILYGSPENLGGIEINKGKEFNKWARRTRALEHNLDFIVVGDAEYYRSRSITYPYPYNENYIEGGNVHGIIIDYSDEMEDEHSFVQGMNAKILAIDVNTPLTIKRRISTQAINTSNFDLTVLGARMFYDIDWLSTSKLTVRGQEYRTLNYSPKGYDGLNMSDFEEWNTPQAYLKGKNIHADVKIDDREKRGGEAGRHKLKRQYHVDGLIVSGWNDINGFPDDAEYNISKIRKQ